MNEPEPLTDEAGVIALDYIIDSPHHQHGGFHPHTVAVAKWAKATITALKTEIGYRIHDINRWNATAMMHSERADAAEDEVERLTPYVEAVRLAGNLARAVEECIGGGDIAMRGHALNALHAYLAYLTEHNLLPEDQT